MGCYLSQIATQETHQSITGHESHFVLLPFADCNLIIASIEVNAIKTVNINQLVQQILNPRE